MMSVSKERGLFSVSLINEQENCPSMALSCCDLSLFCSKVNRITGLVTTTTSSIRGMRLLLTIEHEPKHLDASKDNAQVAYEEVGLEDTANASDVTLEFTGVNGSLAEVCGS